MFASGEGKGENIYYTTGAIMHACYGQTKGFLLLTEACYTYHLN